MTKDTKGVRQVLARLGDWYECDEYHIHDGTGEHEGETPHAEHKDFDEDKAVATLQEIMLGMLPEGREPSDKEATLRKSTLRFNEDGDGTIGSPAQRILTTRPYNDGWNACMKLIEQNIRGGFNNG